MSQLSKQDLKAENQLEFPNNNNGAITPSNLRAFNVDMIDSTVNQTTFDSFSGSVADQFANITGSGVETNTGSLLVTASFDNSTRNLTFTKGNNTQFAVNIPDVSGSTINTGSFATTASFNAYTQSNDQRVTSLESNSASVNTSITELNANTASQQVSIDNLNQFTQSQDTLNSEFSTSIGELNSATSSLFTSASLGLTTASISGQTLTFSKGDGTTFGILIPDVSGSDISQLNSFTASQELLNTTFATTGSNSFIGNQIITGQLSISSSALYDIDITGAFQATANSRISSSVGILNLNITGLTYNSNTASIVSSVVKGQVNSVDSTGAPTTNKYIGISANPSVTGVPTLSAITVPSIITYGATGGTFIAPIQFQHIGGYTDGRVTITTPLQLNSVLTASLQEGYVWVGGTGNVTTLVATSSFGGGGTIDTSSFATTGSNTFTGINTFNEEVRVLNDALIRFENNGTIGGDSGSRLSLDAYTGMQFRNFSNNDVLFEQYGTSSLDFYNYNGTIGITGSATTIQGVNFIPFSASLDARILAITGSGGTIDTGSFATTGSNNFEGNQTITGSLIISSSAVNDLVISGTLAMGGINPLLSMSSSNAGFTLNLGGAGGVITLTSGSFPAGTLVTSAISRLSISQINTPGYQIGMTGKPSTAGMTTANNFPVIFGARPGGNYAAIELQPSQSYTDGRVSMLTPLYATKGLNVSGSTTFTSVNNDLSNVILGSDAMINSLTSNGISVAIGNEAMKFASGSSQNVAIGNRALFRTTGSLNVAIGSEAMPDNTTGTQNFALGVNALNKNTTGNNNVAIGVNAIQNMVISKQQVAIGANALKLMTNGGVNDGQNMVFGYDAMANVITASANTVIGTAALRDARNAEENIFIGGTSGINASGSIANNTVIGNRAAQKIAGNDNTFIGHAAATNLVIGFNNTFIGKNVGDSIITGSNNTLIGKQISGQNNWNNVIALGDGAGNIKFFNSGSQTTLTNDTLISGSLTTTGSVSIGSVMSLTPLDPLPAGTIGMLAVSGSNLYFYNGTWTQII